MQCDSFVFILEQFISGSMQSQFKLTLFSLISVFNLLEVDITLRGHFCFICIPFCINGIAYPLSQSGSENLIQILNVYDFKRVMILNVL